MQPMFGRELAKLRAADLRSVAGGRRVTGSARRGRGVASAWRMAVGRRLVGAGYRMMRSPVRPVVVRPR